MQDICTLWKEKFEGVLNVIDDRDSEEELSRRLEEVGDVDVQLTSPEELFDIIGTLSCGKAPGTDGIPCELYKNAPPNILAWLSVFFNLVLTHQYIPNDITNVMLVPLVKSSLKDPCDSANYRPIAIASTASKIVEKLVLNRLEPFL